jgi:5-(carboxyamino)imidazole ribonucleotide synthase
LNSAITVQGTPAVLKTVRGLRRQRPDDCSHCCNAASWDGSEPTKLFWKYGSTECEVSVVAPVNGDRGVSVFENSHRNHFDVTVCRRESRSNQRDAVEITRAVLETLDVVGVLCVEFL